VRLSKTTNILRGGNSLGSVTRTASPSCQLFHLARFSSGLGGSRDGGRVLRICVNCSLSQGWSTALAQLLTPFTRTSPVAGWNKLMSLAVPFLKCW
jgi:hypothetical protein